MYNTKSTGKKVRTLTILSFLVALSYVGSLIKIQGSIAFDSLPGYFAALFLGPIQGFIVAGLGHFLTALTSGFPLTLPMHLIITLEMAMCGYLFGLFYKKTNGIIASIVAIILNGPILALIAVPTSVLFNLPLNGWGLFSFIIIPLTLASIANVVVAYILFIAISKRTRNEKF